jgi:molybdate transport system ATP-binding protein
MTGSLTPAHIDTPIDTAIGTPAATGTPNDAAEGHIDARFSGQKGAFQLDVALRLAGRGVTAVFGPSGAGKTTLLRRIAGLERSGQGFLSVGGEVWQDDRRGIFLPVHRRPLGFVFQQANLFDHLSVQGNIDYGRRRVPAPSQRVALAELIDLLDLGPLLSRGPASLSGGERQRVAIARALATSPRLLLMDEPLAALDAERKQGILPYLERLHAWLDIPVVYVSHALDEVTRLADNVVLLQAGKVAAQGPVHALMTRLDLPLAHGDSAGAIVDAVVAQVDAAWHLCRADFAGGSIVLTQPAGRAPLAPGRRARLRIQARDVSITLARQQGTSVQNIFAVTVTGISPDAPGQVMLALDAGGSALLARVTALSADALGLAVGARVFAQVKGVAVLN